MDVFNAVRVQINDLVCRICNARLLHCRRGRPKFIHNTLESVRHKRARQLYGTLHLAGVRNRHYARNNGHRNPCLPYFVQKGVQQIVVKEHLRCQKVAARLNLLLQIPDVLTLVHAFRMNLRIARAANTEIRPAFLQLTNQLHRVAVIPFASVRLLQLRRQIAPQSHHIFNAGRFHFLNFPMYHVFCGRYTGQMRQRRHIVQFADIAFNRAAVSGNVPIRKGVCRIRFAVRACTDKKNQRVLKGFIIVQQALIYFSFFFINIPAVRLQKCFEIFLFLLNLPHNVNHCAIVCRDDMGQSHFMDIHCGAADFRKLRFPDHIIIHNV